MTDLAVPHITDGLVELSLLPAASIPETALHAARRTTANIVGLSVGASRHPAYRIAYQAMNPTMTPPQARLLGRAEKASVTVAAFLAGLAAHVEDFDDTHLATVIHPGAPIVPAALAAAEFAGRTPDELFKAVTVGVEATLRVGLALGVEHFDRGWHLTSSTGRLGAAIAAGRLLGLSAGQMMAAISIAATETAGLQSALGTMTKAFHPGKAASDGLEAALLASFGLDGPLRPVEGAYGLLRTAAPRSSAEALLDHLGEVWEIEDNAIKPYACGVVSHPVIDAAIELRDVAPAEEIFSVTLRTHPVVLDVMGVANPVDGLQSKFSARHCFAIGLTAGVGGPAQFSDRAARDPQVVELRRLVSFKLDPAIAKDECYASVELDGGRTISAHVEHCTASAASPMTDAQLVNKVRSVAADVLGDAQAEHLASEILTPHDETTIADLLDLATPSTTIYPGK